MSLSSNEQVIRNRGKNDSENNNGEENKDDMKDIIDKASEHFGLTKINTLIHLNELIKKLTSAGYLIEED